MIVRYYVVCVLCFWAIWVCVDSCYYPPIWLNFPSSASWQDDKPFQVICQVNGFIATIIAISAELYAFKRACEKCCTSQLCMPRQHYFCQLSFKRISYHNRELGTRVHFYFGKWSCGRRTLLWAIHVPCDVPLKDSLVTLY